MKYCKSKMLWAQRSVLILYTHVAIAMMSIVAGQPNNSSGHLSEVKCSSRYDMAAGVAKDMFNNVSCEVTVPEYYRVCKMALTIWNYDLLPYVYTSQNGTLVGILPAILKILVKICCFGCTQLNYQKPFKTMKELTSNFYNKSYYQILMPAIGTKDAALYLGNPYVKLMNNPGVAYLQIDDSQELMLKRLVSSLGDTLPLLAIIVLLTIEGGVIIWLLDTRQNAEEFPRSFIKGSLEGCWWAYVSMTTVGYGDKSPRSFAGRVFGVLWITLGIVISGFFTASITSTLTSATISEKTSLNGKNVGYLEKITYGFEQNIIYRDGGKATGYQKVSDLISSLRRRTIDGILMDRLILRYHWKQFQDSGIKLAVKKDVASTDISFGMIFSDKSLGYWARFLSNFQAVNDDTQSRIMFDAIESMEEKLPDEPPETLGFENGIFGSAVISKNVLITLFGCCAVTVLIGLAATVVYKLYRQKKRKQGTVQNTELAVFKNGRLEDRFEDFSKTVERAVLKDLREQIEQLREDILEKQLDVTSRK
ncbi:glutamate [NMDA] receptor subunit 1-like [Rhopilema esculentum]|uniref:glutamate [NMDA] receptor subunit 1-like n=1 Tax=Rhopilema esculentum TaxID=499914 RepID=UPI0031D75DCE|eukprot:gene1483-15915_t